MNRYTDFTPWAIVNEENLRSSTTREEQTRAAIELSRIMRLEMIYRFKESHHV